MFAGNRNIAVLERLMSEIVRTGPCPPRCGTSPYRDCLGPFDVEIVGRVFLAADRSLWPISKLLQYRGRGIAHRDDLGVGPPFVLGVASVGVNERPGALEADQHPITATGVHVWGRAVRPG